MVLIPIIFSYFTFWEVILIILYALPHIKPRNASEYEIKLFIF